MLSEMIEAARRRAAALDPAELERAADLGEPARDFRAALLAPGLAVIAEIKRASPSRGLLDPDLDAATLASAYEAGGAAAVSVLTEPNYFLGSSADLQAVRSAVQVPVLRKDFIVDPAQVWEARAAGADALLLIVAALDGPLFESLLAETRRAGLVALVEVHTEAEAERAVAAGAAVIGVNNRDLSTFEVDLSVAENLAPLIAGRAALVAESGIWSREDAARMAAAGYDGVLVGESLVRAGKAAGLISELRRAR